MSSFHYSRNAYSFIPKLFCPSHSSDNIPNDNSDSTNIPFPCRVPEDT